MTRLIIAASVALGLGAAGGIAYARLSASVDRFIDKALRDACRFP